MRARRNRWQVAICAELKIRSPLSIIQIWDGMAASGFEHKSAAPRQTLGARLAELVAQGDIRRIGPSLYQIESVDAGAPSRAPAGHALIEERGS